MDRRKDGRGRILRTGEGQRKDGRYYYRYRDASGRERHAYSWTLTTHDATPPGRTPGPCLRELERRVQHDLFMMVAPTRMTVSDLVGHYVNTRANVRPTTRAGYETVRRFLASDPMGAMAVSDVTAMYAREWLVTLQRNGKGYSTLRTLRGVLKPAFELAVMDGMTLRNPFAWELQRVLLNDSHARVALTREQERRFMAFVREDPHYSRYHDAFLVLLRTGLRISEFCGLTVDDVDLARSRLRVERQLQRTSGMTYYVEVPKTRAGTRTVPLGSEAREAFARILDARPTPEVETDVDGVGGFLFLDKEGRPLVAMHWQHRMKHAREAFDRTYRKPLGAKVTPHVMRHTYATRLAANGVSPATIQRLLGHGSYEVTAAVYVNAEDEEVVDADARELRRHGL